MLQAELVTSKAAKKSEKSSCVIPISLGQPEHEGELLVATLTRAAHEYDSITIMVADTLQFHTRKMLGSTLSDEDLRASLRKEGTEWEERNKKAIDECLGDKLNKIIHWDHWLNHKNYKARRQKIDAAYETEKSFSVGVNATIDHFVKKRKNAIAVSDSDTTVTRNLSKQYILEEAAVLLLWKAKGYLYILYPHKLSAAMNYVITKMIHKKDCYVLRPYFLKFKDSSPQTATTTATIKPLYPTYTQFNMWSEEQTRQTRQTRQTQQTQQALKLIMTNINATFEAFNIPPEEQQAILNELANNSPRSDSLEDYEDRQKDNCTSPSMLVHVTS